MQPACADVLHPLVHLRCDARDLADAVRSELEGRAFSRAQRGVLLGERVLGLRHDADEISFSQRRQLDADREAALQLRDQVRWLRDVKRAGGDEEHVIGAHVAVARLHRRAFDDRQQVALDAFTRHVRPGSVALAGDLVDLVDEDDAVVLDTVQRLVHDVVHVHQLLQLLVDQDAPRLRDLHRASLLLFRHHLLQHLGEVDVGPLHPLRRLHVLEQREGLLLHFPLHVAVFELAVAQLLAQLLARATPPLLTFGVCLGHFGRDVAFGRDNEERTRLSALSSPVARSRGGWGDRGGRRCRDRRQEQIEQAVLRALLRFRVDVVLALGTNHVDGHVDELAHHGFHVPPNVAHLGELRCLDLEERGARQPRQSTRDLGLPHAGRADHDDVVGEDFVPDVVRRLGAPPAVAHRDGHRLLSRLLPHDVAVELRHDLARRQFLKPREGLLFRRSWRCRRYRRLLGVGAAGRFGHRYSSRMVMWVLV